MSINLGNIRRGGLDWWHIARREKPQRGGLHGDIILGHIDGRMVNIAAPSINETKKRDNRASDHTSKPHGAML